MGHPNKIDNEKLKAMLAEGKFTNDIAATFGCVESAVNTRIQRLGLKPNYRRKRNDGAENKDAPAPGSVRQPGTDLNYNPSSGACGQVIPLTLRLNVEVNVRVSTERG